MQVALSTEPKTKFWAGWAKSVIDRVGAVVAIIVFAPVWIAVSVAIWATMGRPVLFFQDRVGKNERIFRMFKFRTMREPEALRPGQKITDIQRGKTDDERITPLGRWLRRMSLDELPQLVNVLRGEMSLVGPRPQLAAYLHRYDDKQRRRHRVLPGMTGLAQVRGRNLLTWERKFELDVEYVDNWSLALDLRLMLQTVGVVLSGDGVEAAGGLTPQEFRGTLDRATARAGSERLDQQAA